MEIELTKTFSFEAAHSLPNIGKDHPCSKIHGHSYKVDITVKGEIDPNKGWFVDYAVIEMHWKPIVEVLDHNLLNNIEGLKNPTCENLCICMVQWLARLPGLCKITVHETETSSCTLRI